MLNCVIVGLGGFVGAVLRYLIGLVPINQQSGFPIKTFLINVVGAFTIGAVAAFAARSTITPRAVLFLKVGICGGFTTFSSFALEIDQLFTKGQTMTAILYMTLSVVSGVLAVEAAYKLFV